MRYGELHRHTVAYEDARGVASPGDVEASLIFDQTDQRRGARSHRFACDSLAELGVGLNERLAQSVRDSALFKFLVLDQMHMKRVLAVLGRLLVHVAIEYGEVAVLVR